MDSILHNFIIYALVIANRDRAISGDEEHGLRFLGYFSPNGYKRA